LRPLRRSGGRIRTCHLRVMRRHDLGQVRSEPPVWAISGHLGSHSVGSGGQTLGKGVPDAPPEEWWKRRSRAAGECRPAGPVAVGTRAGKRAVGGLLGHACARPRGSRPTSIWRPGGPTACGRRVIHRESHAQGSSLTRRLLRLIGADEQSPARGATKGRRYRVQRSCSRGQRRPEAA
jgi:hypothetical protein